MTVRDTSSRFDPTWKAEKVAMNRKPQSDAADDHEDTASFAEQPQPGLLAEFWDFLCHNKKWWFTPIIIILLLAGILFVLSRIAGPSFIYTID